MGKFVKIGDTVINKDNIISVGEIYCEANDVYHSDVRLTDSVLKAIRRARRDRSFLESLLDIEEYEIAKTLGYSNLSYDIPAYMKILTTNENYITVRFDDVEDAISARKKLINELLNDEDEEENK